MAGQEDISYCGLYCGRCFIRLQDIADQALCLLNKFREVRFEKWAKGLAELNPEEMAAFAKQEDCYKVLQAWDAMRCSGSCRDGGGSPRCAIRECCRLKSAKGCWECAEFESCSVLGSLKPVNGDVNVRNIQRILEIGLELFAEEREKEGDRNFY
jgi:hypothetical protein